MAPPIDTKPVKPVNGIAGPEKPQDRVRKNGWILVGLLGALVGAAFVLVYVKLVDPNNFEDDSARVAGLSKQLEALGKENTNLKRSLDSSDAEKVNLERELQNEKNRGTQLDKNLSELQRKLNDATRRRPEDDAQRDSLIRERDEANSKLSAKNQENKKLKQDLANAKDKIKALERRLADTQGQQVVPIKPVSPPSLSQFNRLFDDVTELYPKVSNDRIKRRIMRRISGGENCTAVLQDEIGSASSRSALFFSSICRQTLQ